MKNKKKKIIAFSMILFLISVIIVTITVKVFTKDETINIENIARKYLEDNNINCDAYCEVTSKELIEKGYAKNIDNNLLISFSTIATGETNSEIRTIAEPTNTTISGYTAEVKETSMSSSSATVNFSKTSDGKDMVTISDDYSWAGWEYNFTNLVNNKIYLIEANVTLSNLELTRNNMGAIIGIKKFDYCNTPVYSSETLTENGTKTIRAIFMPTASQKSLKITVSLGNIVNADNKFLAKGSMKVNSLTLREVNETSDKDVTVKTSPNKLIKEVMFKSDYDTFNVSTSQYNDHLTKMENVYNAYADLVGHSSRTSNILTPDNKTPIVIMMANDTIIYGAVAGNPIQTNRSWTEGMGDMIKKGQLSWGPLHELGHVFTLFKLTDGTIETTPGLPDFDSEMTASMIPLYALDKYNYYLTDSTTKNGYNVMIDNYKTGYDNRFSEDYFKTHDWDAAGLEYLMFQTTKNGKPDWDAMKQAYKWFNDLSKDEESHVKTNWEKFLWFIKKIDDNSSDSPLNHFKPEDLKVTINNYARKYYPITNININDGTINVGKSKLNISTEPTGYTDIVEYSSNNPNVKIDDFGNVNVTNEYYNVQITAKSYLNSSVSKTKNINFYNPVINATIPNLYTQMRNNKEIELDLRKIATKPQITATVTQSGVDKTSIFNPKITNVNVSDDTNTGTATLTMKTDRLNETGTYTLNIYVNEVLRKTVNFNVTEPEYTMISTPQQLQNIKNDLTGAYKLAQDIDLKNFNFEMIGSTMNDLKGNFSGLLDGDGHSIKNLNMTSTSDVGLFGGVQEGTIRNLKIESANIEVTSTSSAVKTGILASALYDDSYIYNVSTSGIIKAGDGRTGGIVGRTVYSSIIENCYNFADIIINQKTYSPDVAGIIGSSYNGDRDLTIKNVYNSGNITINAGSKNKIFAGGIVGGTDITTGNINIENTYNVGNIKSNNDSITNVGIINGTCSSYYNGKINIKNSYALTDLYPTDNDTSCIVVTNSSKKTISQMKQQSTYNGYNFSSTWEILNNTLPTLRSNKYYYTSSIAADDTITLINNGTTYDIKDYITINPSNSTDPKLTYEVSTIGGVKAIEVDSNGKIKTLNAGQATITIDTNDGSHITKEVNVNVENPKAEIKIDSTTLNPDTIYNNKSGTVTLNLTTKNISNGAGLTVKVKNKSTSSDVSGFSVSGNTVNSNKATIVVTTPSKIEMDNDTTYTVEISSGSTKVTKDFTIKKYIYVNEIRVSKDNFNMLVGTKEDITVEVLPGNANNKEYNVENTNDSVAVYNKAEGKIEAKKKGNTTITFKAKDGSNIQKSITVNVVEPKITINSKSLSPNPIYNNASGEVTFNVVTEDIKDGTELTLKFKNKNTSSYVSGFSVSGNTVNSNKATIVVTIPSNIEMDNDTVYTVEISSGSTKTTGDFTIKKYIYVNEIRVNEDNLTMNIGDIKDITVEVLPDGAINKEYEVEEGYDTNTVNVEKTSNKITVTAKNSGNTTVKLKAKDGSETEKNINVSVNSIKLNLNATIGDSPYTSGNLTNKEVKVTLSVENIEEEDVTYKYSDDNKSSWKDYTNGTTFKNIDKEIFFKAVDSEERESNIVSVHINSDMISPELKVSYKKYKEVTTSTELIDTTKTFDSRISLYLKSDDTSGSLKYQLDDEEEKVITGDNINCDTCNTIDLTKNKEYRLEVTLSDKAGNKVEKTYNLTIDNNVYNIDVTINNGKYKGSGTYENQDNFKSTVDTREEEARFKISPDEYYEYKGSNITCDKEGVTTSYSDGEMILENYNDIEDDMTCEITFEEIDYETTIETDEHGSIEGVTDKITQKHSDSKKYTLKQDRGYIYKSFICDNANISYNSEDSSVTISEVRDNGTCTYETQKQESNIPKIDEVNSYVINETKDRYETNKWVNKKVKIDIEASDDEDGSGIKEILYRTSKDREWKVYTEDIEFENTNDTIYFKVIDYSDNESEVYSLIIKSDTVVPSTPKISSILDETNDIYTPNTFTNKKINIILESIDEMSGISKYQYKIGSKKVSLLDNKVPQVRQMAIETEWQDVTDNKITIGDVTDVVYFRAIDNAGNISEVSSIVVNSNTTKVSNVDEDKQNPEPNPQTGINIPLITLFIILISGISILIYTRKNNRFPNV